MDEIRNQRFNTSNGFIDTSLKSEFQLFLEQGYQLINTWDYIDGNSFKAMSPNTMTNKNMLITDKFQPQWCMAFETTQLLKSMPDQQGYKWIFRCFKLDNDGRILVKQTVYVEPKSIFGQSESYIKSLIENAYQNGSWLPFASWYSAQRINPSSGQFPLMIPVTITGVFTVGETKYLATKAESNGDSIYAKDYYELTGNELYQGLEGAVLISKTKYATYNSKVLTNQEIYAKQTVVNNVNSSVTGDTNPVENNTNTENNTTSENNTNSENNNTPTVDGIPVSQTVDYSSVTDDPDLAPSSEETTTTVTSNPNINTNSTNITLVRTEYGQYVAAFAALAVVILLLKK